MNNDRNVISCGREEVEDFVRTYTTNEVVEATGATRRQLDYWRTSGRIPSLKGSSPGSGHSLRWTDQDVRTVELIVAAKRVFRLPKPMSSSEQEEVVSA